MSTCEMCKGSGNCPDIKVEPGNENVSCSACGGNGKIPENTQVTDNPVSIEESPIVDVPLSQETLGDVVPQN